MYTYTGLMNYMYTQMYNLILLTTHAVVTHSGHPAWKKGRLRIPSKNTVATHLVIHVHARIWMVILLSQIHLVLLLTKLIVRRVVVSIDFSGSNVPLCSVHWLSEVPQVFRYWKHHKPFDVCKEVISCDIVLQTQGEERSSNQTLIALQGRPLASIIQSISHPTSLTHKPTPGFQWCTHVIVGYHMSYCKIFKEDWNFC